MPEQVDPPRFIRPPQVIEMTGMGKTFIYSRISDGTFPKQIQLVLGLSSGTNGTSSTG